MQEEALTSFTLFDAYHSFTFTTHAQ